MNKKLIALAVASAVVAPAAMADGVQIYGQMNAGFEVVKADTSDNAATTSRTRVSDWTSRIGFKGTEKLSNGLTAIWQLESRIRPDDMNGSSSAGTLGSRNSYVGLAGNFGAVVLGRHDTPYKLVGAELNPLTGTSADFTGGFSTATLNGGGIFSRGEAVAGRENNVIAYLSPNFNGLSFKVAHVSDEGKTNSVNARKHSFSIDFEANGLKAGLGYARANDVALAGITNAATGTTEGNVAAATKLAASYTFNNGNTMVGGGYDRVVANVAGLQERKQSSLLLSATHKLTPELQLIANMGWLGKVKLGGADVADTGAKQFTLGAKYSLSKRTNLVGFYTKVTNQAAATVDVGAGAGNAVGAAAGQDPHALAVGIQHSF